MKKTSLLFLSVLALSLTAPLGAGAVAAETLRIFAAASLGGVLEPIAKQWTGTTHQQVSLSFAGSSVLARQIQQGAPADIFISANSLWMDALETSGDVQRDSRQPLLTNSLVLITHSPDTAPIAIEPGFDLRASLGDGMLAMALTEAVPAGIYGKQALTRLGVWNRVADRVAQTDNVRAALALVARGEARLGIVYASDAQTEPQVSVVGHFPADSHDPIIYPIAQTSQSQHPQARAFLDYLSSESARLIFRQAGFGMAD
jgi:molybdate transport system substrate-binding protein